MSKIITRWAIAVLILFSSVASSSNATITEYPGITIVMPERKISKAKSLWSRSRSRCVKLDNYLHFEVEGKVDTNITETLRLALLEYTGPKAMITSLKRAKRNNSAHNHGNAVDLRWDKSLIEYLVTADGSQWLAKYNLMFYIEGRPGSRRLKPYKGDPIYSKFVFENPLAEGKTGDHIHIGIRR